MPADKPTELSRIKQITWTRQLVPMISEHSAHSTPQPFWHSHLALAIYMFVVVNFDALAQASDIRIERIKVVFLCWMQDSNPSGSQTPNRQQTQCPLTNRLSYRGSSKKLELDSSSLWSASIQPTRPHSRFGIRTWLWRYTCLLLLMCTHMGSISIKLHLKQILIYTYYTRTKYCSLIIESSLVPRLVGMIIFLTFTKTCLPNNLNFKSIDTI